MKINNDLVINSSGDDIEIAIIENDKLVEIHKEKTGQSIAVGDIFLGSIKKVMPGLNAAFVELGVRSDGFLHYTDIGPQVKSMKKYVYFVHKKKHENSLLKTFPLEPDNRKDGRMGNVFRSRDKVLVQVIKEPISTKGPRLTCEITIPGRYIVLHPFNSATSISKKISDPNERQRLKNILESIRPKNFGVILRTASEGKGTAELYEELKTLLNDWNKIFLSLQKDINPGLILSEVDKTSGIIRDMLNSSFNKIVVNDKAMYENIVSYMDTISPTQKKIVSEYKGKKPIFDQYGVTRQIKSSFGKNCTMASGAYLVIEHTEAMHVIDVNSGPKSKRLNQEDAAIQVNMEAAKEIARQIRLRDIGGLIIIDFIDMRKSDNKSTLYKLMKSEMENDRAQHTILPLSRFGLMQITRQRVRPEINIETQETCPSCNGTGKLDATILIEENINKDLEKIMQTNPKTKIILHVHPYLYAYLKKGWFSSFQWKWYKKYQKWVKLRPDNNFGIVKYKFFSGENDEIRLYPDAKHKK